MDFFGLFTVAVVVVWLVSRKGGLSDTACPGYRPRRERQLKVNEYGEIEER